MAPQVVNLSGQSVSLSEDNILRLYAKVKAHGHPRGSILFLALWSLCLLSTFAVVLGYGLRQKLSLIKRLDEKDRLRLIADAGVKKTMAWFRQQPPKAYAGLADEWSNDPALFKDINIEEGKFSIAYTYYDEQAGFSNTRYGLVDEESKINLNKASQDVLERLFKLGAKLSEMEAQDLAASIIDWRDKDSQLSVPLGSAEDSYYRNLEFPYEAKDADFDSLDEALLVKGLSQEIFEKIKGYITIYGEGKVNINTASRAVLLALGFDQGTVEEIISLRAATDRVSGTSDDNIFEAVSDIVPKLSQAYHLSDSEITQISQLVEQNLTVYSNNFMIRSLAKLNNHRNTLEVISVINRAGKILYWYEY